MGEFDAFIEAVFTSKDRASLEDFLLGITTEKERAEFSKRLAIVKRLIKKEPQHQIAKDLGVGIATVTRGSKELAHGRFKQLREKLRPE